MMSPEQEIQELKSQVAQLYTMLANLQAPEMPELRNGPQIRHAVHASPRPLDGEVLTQGPAPSRRTLEPNPESNTRKGREQLVNAHKAEKNAISAFVLVLDANGTGMLVPATLDAHRVEDATASDGYSVAVNDVDFKDYKRIQLWQFGNASDVGACAAEDLLLLRVQNGLNGRPELKYLSKNSLLTTGGEDPQPTLPDHDHSGDEGDGGKIDHPDLDELCASDDHRGGREAASAAENAHAYLHVNGGAARNAMGENSAIGDRSGAASVSPDARTLDGAASESKGWKVTSTIEATAEDYETGALVVAGGQSISGQLQTQLATIALRLIARSFTDNREGAPAITSNGGVYAAKSIQSDTLFRCGASDGKTESVSLEDVNGRIFTFNFVGGLYTGCTIA